MSHGCPFWQPSCAFCWSAPDGPEWLGMAHADYASPIRGATDHEPRLSVLAAVLRLPLVGT